MTMPVYADDALHLLARGASTNYTICSLRVFLYPNCSTIHDVSGTAGGSILCSHCLDPSDKQAYFRSVPDTVVPLVPNHDWVQIGFEWAMAISLNDGIVNANSSTARLLTQSIGSMTAETGGGLPGLQPSMAKSLAVLAGSTLLTSSTMATLRHYWPNQSPILHFVA
jgi:hypothetical protein